MLDRRLYGTAPFYIAVVHGGPGNPGDVAAVAIALSKNHGVIEPIQTKKSMEAQIRELRKVLKQTGNPPFILIGHSWGAWLAYIVAARYPSLVRKLILVGSGPFEEFYSDLIEKKRLERLSVADREDYLETLKGLRSVKNKDQDRLLRRLGRLISRTDNYDPVPTSEENGEILLDGNQYQKVWKEASRFRKSGKLLKLGKNIRCPVISIHGDYDPHPAQGVEVPLARTIPDFKMILLKNCGHKPWIEKQAREKFFEALEKEIIF